MARKKRDEKTVQIAKEILKEYNPKSVPICKIH